jgi:membrane protease YdiL (CAAX protease family)
MIISAAINALATAVLEEVAFRGILMKQLSKKFNNRTTVFLSSLGFFLIHGTIFPTPFIFAMTVAVLTIMVGNLLPAIALHFVVDTVGYIGYSSSLTSAMDPGTNISVSTLIIGSSSIAQALMGIIAIFILIFKSKLIEGKKNA